MSSDPGRVAALVAKYPRLLGVLLAILLAASHAGTAAANHASTIG